MDSRCLPLRRGNIFQNLPVGYRIVARCDLPMAFRASAALVALRPVVSIARVAKAAICPPPISRLVCLPGRRSASRNRNTWYLARFLAVAPDYSIAHYSFRLPGAAGFGWSCDRTVLLVGAPGGTMGGARLDLDGVYARLSLDHSVRSGHRAVYLCVSRSILGLRRRGNVAIQTIW